MDCKDFKAELPDLVLTPGAVPGAAAAAHLKVCPPCAEEYVSFQNTFGLLDSWKPIKPSAYFDSKLHARVRAEQAAPAMGWLERLQSRMLFNTGRNFRPAMAGALALVMVAAGGGFLGLTHQPAVPQTSATVTDLQILDRNEQAFQQMDDLQQDDDNDATPASGSPNQATPPTT